MNHEIDKYNHRIYGVRRTNSAYNLIFNHIKIKQNDSF